MFKFSQVRVVVFLLMVFIILLSFYKYDAAEGLSRNLTEPGSVSLAPGDFPASLDLSVSPAFPPIGDQGGALNSCVGWATTYYQLTYETALARGLNARSGDTNIIFSPKWTYNMINGGSNSDSQFQDAYNLLYLNGAATWADFPYDGQDYRGWSLDPAVWRKAINYRINPATSITLGSDSDVDSFIAKVKTQLINKHVAVYSTYVGSWEYTLHRVGNDPYREQYIAAYMRNTKRDLHAQIIVGYDDNIWVDLNGNGAAETGEKGAFKVANSRGTGWGNSGYFWISYDALRTFSAVPISATWPNTDRALTGIFNERAVNVFTARQSYSPAYVAAVTFQNIDRRNQIFVSLGIGANGTQPTDTWNSVSFNGTGGDMAFDGKFVSDNGTFYFDFTDLAVKAAPNSHWFLGVKDSVVDQHLTTVGTIQLYKGADTSPIVSQNATPSSVNGRQVWYDITPPAAATPTPTTSPTPSPSPSPTPTPTPTVTPTINYPVPGPVNYNPPAPIPTGTPLTLIGLESSIGLTADSTGAAGSTIQLKNKEGTIFLDIKKGTLMQNTDGTALKAISGDSSFPLPEPPENSGIVGYYALGPYKAKFSPAISLTLKYDPEKLPAQTKETDLYLAYQDGDKWVNVKSQVNTEAKIISAEITQFSHYAVLVKLPAQPPPTFTISPLIINPVEVEADKPVNIQTTLTNTGSSSGKYSLVLKVNGIQQSVQNISLAAGQTQMVTMTVKMSVPGEYDLDVNGTTGKFKVTAPVVFAIPSAAAAVPLAASPSPTEKSLEISVSTLPVSSAAANSKAQFRFPAIWLVVIGLVIAALGIYIPLSRRKEE